jgi:hypothetical protein
VHPFAPSIRLIGCFKDVLFVSLSAAIFLHAQETPFSNPHAKDAKK